AQGLIRQADADDDPDRNALTSHLGTETIRQIDRSVRPLPLLEGDRVLVCSDGVYRALSSDEMAAPLTDNPQRACETLITRVNAKRLDRQDNMTAIVIAVDGDHVITGSTETLVIPAATPGSSDQETRRP